MHIGVSIKTTALRKLQDLDGCRDPEAVLDSVLSEYCKQQRKKNYVKLVLLKHNSDKCRVSLFDTDDIFISILGGQLSSQRRCMPLCVCLCVYVCE